MPAIEFHMDGSLARAARHLCQVSVRTVARRAGLDTKAVRKYEKGGDTLSAGEIQQLTDALTYFGARFVPEDENGGVGVRRKFTRTAVTMIDTWEDEGGPVAEDDV
ncbi:helix-turn-helix domain-containing protein [Gordonia sp. VNK21]|uniref:helix-turn-helix domain-containing protein n=1 Tax=Gordonia sp. VNK21 TaxID=3382483 RepID=UPI0038D4BCB0